MEMQGVVQVYTDLKQKGIEFPSLEETMAPIITPSRVRYTPILQIYFISDISHYI